MRANSDTGKSFGLALAVLLVVLGVLFHKSFDAKMALFANDGPLGANAANYGKLPEAFSGMWNDLYWVGGWQGTMVPNLTCFQLWSLNPVGFAKFVVPVSLLLLGVCSWFFFRQLRFNGVVCLAGALASMLNSNAFSNGCWGLPTWVTAKAMVFLAMGLLLMRNRPEWLRIPLAGLAIGMCVMEGFDTGAIFSIYAAIFALFLFVEKSKDVDAKVWGIGIAKVAIISIFAVFIAAQTLSTLIGTQIKGVSGTEQDSRTKEQRWDFATQWSLPKIEVLRVIIPGLYGYRMDTPDGGQYWGTVGQQPGWEIHKQGIVRYSGSGEYAGVLVVILALWAVVQMLRGAGSSYSPEERRWVRFWAIVALISLLFAFGRYAPFYQLLYKLPYFSTIRNPIKFMQPFHLALVILFAYGLQDIFRRFVEVNRERWKSFKEEANQWWGTSVDPFVKRWTIASAFYIGGSMLAWLLFVSGRPELLRHLKATQFDDLQAAAIAGFASVEIGIYVLFLLLSVLLLTLTFMGTFAGNRSKWMGIFVCAILVVDLGRANQPWVIYYDYKEKYESNAIVDILREKPNEHRVATMPFDQFPQLAQFRQFYHTIWLQHHFPFYNVQTIDIAQEPRTRVENDMYKTNIARMPVRLWQLTSTRYLFGISYFQTPQGMVNFIELFNQQVDPEKKRFRIHTAFNLSQKSDNVVDVNVTTNGMFALVEFTGALPRAKLYTNWRTLNDDDALKELVNPAFDPDQSVIVAENIAPSATAPMAMADSQANPVTYAHYSPKHIQLKGRALAPSILLLNDKHDPNWHVTVNGEEKEMLRCNFLMRGVQVPPGEFTVDFKFVLPSTTKYISWAAVFVALLLTVLLLLRRTPETAAEAPAKSTAPGKKTSESSP